MSRMYKYVSVKLAIEHKQLINLAIHDNISPVQELVVTIIDQNTTTLNKNVS